MIDIQVECKYDNAIISVLNDIGLEIQGKYTSEKYNTKKTFFIFLYI